MTRWSHGQHITWRNVKDGRVEYAFPAVVLQDNEDAILLFQQHGSVAKRMAGDRGPVGQKTSSQLAPMSWSGAYEDYRYSGPHVVRAYRWGDPFSIIRSVAPDLRRIFGWYVNVELPWRRSPIGFDSRDLVLDLRWREGLWEREDEDELLWAVERGIVSPGEEQLARQAAENALAYWDKREGSFGAPWEEIRIDPDWPQAVVSENWRKV